LVTVAVPLPTSMPNTAPWISALVVPGAPLTTVPPLASRIPTPDAPDAWMVPLLVTAPAPLSDTAAPEAAVLPMNPSLVIAQMAAVLP
jgi:hypothetical protein